MAFASFDRKSRSAPLAEINMVPLIDVMLVLLVIFIVSSPLLTHAVMLELPQATSQVTREAPQKIALAVDAQGERWWNGEQVTRAESVVRFKAEGIKSFQPEIHLSADQAVAYRHVAQVLADAASAGLTQIAFVSQPERL